MSYTKSYILEYYSVNEQDGPSYREKPEGMQTNQYNTLGYDLKHNRITQDEYDRAFDAFAPSPTTSQTPVSAPAQPTADRFNVGGEDISSSGFGTELRAIRGLSNQFSKDIGTNIQSGIEGGIDYATSLPTLGKVALGATLAGGGAALGAGLVNRAFRKRTEKKKKKKTLNEYNPYSQRLTPAATGGAAGATVGTLSGLLGGKAAAKALTSALKITNPTLATTIDILGQGFGTAIGGGVGGYTGYEFGKALTPKKKKKRNPLLPSYYDQA